MNFRASSIAFRVGAPEMTVSLANHPVASRTGYFLAPFCSHQSFCGLLKAATGSELSTVRWATAKGVLQASLDLGGSAGHATQDTPINRSSAKRFIAASSEPSGQVNVANQARLVASILREII